MSIITDFSAISTRLREIEGKKPTAEPKCDGCDGSGREVYDSYMGVQFYRDCPKCNPKGLPCP